MSGVILLFSGITHRCLLHVSASPHNVWPSSSPTINIYSVSVVYTGKSLVSFAVCKQFKSKGRLNYIFICFEYPHRT